MTNPSDSSSPITVDGVTVGGLTKRELFALEAMKAVEIANIPNEFQEIINAREVANRAVAIADFMMQRLNSDKPLEAPKKG